MSLDIYSAWAKRHGVTIPMLNELFGMLGVATVIPNAHAGESESRVQSRVRLWYARNGITLFRNNVGVLEDARGVPVRYGLANDTKAINQVMKSGDLIGWHERLITPDMVGSIIAQFASIECKHANWKYTGDKHELAQLKWIEIVNKAGGYAQFTNGAECAL